ncbi:DUF6541 family protein [Arthrobacter sp. MMS18-M83]|uniref:DUF6541 family protein n=1 Tax=Arthrobacter sp. MMS18-M83 TaxID=2996261 RepID=UPI00227A685A|nr:DUF6541 family protein [Arthrobacter sp. MMS18-M83]WAH96521.1 hypothetical protein OW521_19270 [Arthrobacter sp. MMS18-M83]
MTWPDTVPLLLAAGVILMLPGGVVAATAGLRGLMLAAVAPVITVTIAATSAVLLPYAAIPWSPVAVLMVSILAATFIFGLRVIAQGRTVFKTFKSGWRPDRSWPWMVAAFIVGAAILVAQITIAFGTPSSISQTFDNVFHLNGVRFILDTGNASSLTMSKMASGDNPPYFYPAAWHDLASLLILVTGAPLAIAVNVLNIAVAAIVWPAGCMLLTRVFIGKQPFAVGAAAVLSALFSGFPLLLLDFGVLYPNFLAIALLPVALSSVVLLFGVARDVKVSAMIRFGLPCAVIPGLALAHPNGFMSLVALTIPVLLQRYLVFYLRQRRYRSHRREWILATTGVLVFAGVVVVLWKYIRPPEEAAFWPPIQSPIRAVYQIISTSAMDRPVAITVSILVILGILASLRRPQRAWMVGCFLVIAFLFVVVSAAPVSRLRAILTGVWYNDSYRLAALVPLVAIPFAAVGLDALWAAVRRRLAELPNGRRTRFIAVTAIGLLGIAGTAALLPPLGGAISSARHNYTEDNDSPLLSLDEHKIISKLDAVVPRDATIAVNPWTGSALAYALADRDTTAKHILTSNTRDVELLNQQLRNADHDPAVCAAARSAKVKYVLDFGSKEVHGGSHSFPGLENLQTSTSVKLVLQEGDARLYELTACGTS